MPILAPERRLKIGDRSVTDSTKDFSNGQQENKTGQSHTDNGRITLGEIDRKALDMIAAIRSLLESGYVPTEYHSASQELVLVGPDATRTQLKGISREVIEFLSVK